MKVFVLAQNRKEAQELFDAGCGYETRTAALKARAAPEIDSYYRNLMKVFQFTYKENDNGKCARR